jgi:hypothetical protein
MSNGHSNQFAKPIAPRVTLGAINGLDFFILAAAGMVAACALALVPTPIRVPGHAILKAALPIAAGVALVARPMAGTLASSFGLLASAILMLLGMGHLSMAAMVSLVSFGPAVDFALRNTSGKWHTLFRLSLAGLAANLLAFSVRWGSALFQNDLLHSLGSRQFVASALLSFVVCGLAAGGIAGLLYSCRRGDSGVSP